MATSLPFITNLAQGGTQLAGGVVQASARREQSRFQRRSLEFQQSVREMQAEEAFKAGALAASRQRSRMKRALGMQRVSFAGQGVAVDIGTPLDVQAETRFVGSVDAMTIRNNARRAGMGLLVQAEELELREELARAAGRTEIGATLLTAGLGFSRSVVRGIEQQRLFDQLAEDNETVLG